MIKNLDISFEDSVDINELRAFYRTYYDIKHRITQFGYLEWLIEKNPLSHGKILICRIDSKIAGSIILVPIKTNEHVNCFGYYASEVLTDRRFAKSNIFVKMIRFINKFIHDNSLFIIGHPNAASKPGWKRCKMNFKGDFCSYLTKVSPMKSIGYHEYLVNNAYDINSRASEIEKLNSSTKYVSLVADAEYLIWRYIEHPTDDYYIKLHYIHKELIGLTVYKKKYHLVERILHSVVCESYRKDVYSGRFFPKIISFCEDINYHGKYIYNYQVGQKVNYFFTNKHSDSRLSDVGVTYVSCDN